MAQHLLPHPPAALGVAVSGGGDSVALLHLLNDVAQMHGILLHAITVDHGLRPEAKHEADTVSALCQTMRVPHTIVRWSGWDRQGNLQKEARDARYRLIADWARDHDISTVALGHTLDDQAETVLMRLARGAGVDGLSAMAPRRLANGVTWIRPLLDFTRAELREDLRGRGATWIEDPSNQDTRFDRIRAREALEALGPLGLDARALGQVAFNMARARDALNWQAFLEARRIARVDAGAVRIDWRSYRTLPDETARRILLSAIGWISGSGYAPRRRPVLGLIEALKQGTGGTVDGCQAWRDRDTLWVFREYQPVRALKCRVDARWDDRWVLKGGLPDEQLHLGALGDAGLAQLRDWRTAGLPRDVLRVTPAVWRDQELVAAPMAGHRNGWHASIDGGEEAFFAALLSH
ncbi:tRNA lysidine(34) synthetase TilS [Roseobacter sinensis]|uniref:tRNA(Ile)-lysidine synthase n=1 Tax=Roseobacter sinensis TaxID=2931391 RepID=A0ABT3BH28_9RHOB|nr:tRNA lysidine(34) synthetase TilS [Roseobacter sp. WL0113]MCV3272890.1 tRNA lysidine(34) synthetase TilS [Roseobacter sp. WL0113]